MSQNNANFSLGEAVWIQRMAAESLIHGDNWENPDKRRAIANLLAEISTKSEQLFKSASEPVPEESMPVATSVESEPMQIDERMEKFGVDH